MRLSLRVNGQPLALEIEPGALLLDVLRDAGYTGVKRGCEAGTCGSCAVLVDGVPHYSCIIFAAALEGREITTIEGLGDTGRPHPIMTAFAEEAGVQCGYCVPGMILSTKALLEHSPDPDEIEIKAALDGHLCRCTGYVKQIKAVRRAAELIREKDEEVR